MWSITKDKTTELLDTYFGILGHLQEIDSTEFSGWTIMPKYTYRIIQFTKYLFSPVCLLVIQVSTVLFLRWVIRKCIYSALIKHESVVKFHSLVLIQRKYFFFVLVYFFLLFLWNDLSLYQYLKLIHFWKICKREIFFYSRIGSNSSSANETSVFANFSGNT